MRNEYICWKKKVQRYIFNKNTLPFNVNQPGNTWITEAFKHK